MVIEGGKTLQRLVNSDKRVRVVIGSARAGKTWDCINHIILYCLQNTAKTVTICRAKLTWLKMSVLVDFRTIMTGHGLWDEGDFNKSEMTYSLRGNTISFVGLDDPQRLHGRKQDIAYLNELIEIGQMDWDQVEMRTTDHIIADLNPSNDEHFVWTKILPRPDCERIHVTFMDNIFLDDSIRQKLLSYNPDVQANVSNGTADKFLWSVYGLGIASRREGAVYDNYRFVPLSDFPEDSDWSVGLDFGFTNDPSTAVRVAYVNGEVWLDEVLYEHGLTNPHIAEYLSAICNVQTYDEDGNDTGRTRRRVVCDSAEPKSIQELRDLGIDAVGVAKGADSIRAGIALLRRQRMNVTERSAGLRRELTNYVWKRGADGKFTNSPVDAHNHVLDAARYVANDRWGKRPSAIPVFSFINMRP